MTVGSAAYLEVQWIDIYFNTSSPMNESTELKRGQASRCLTVCAADGLQQIGNPEVVYCSKSAPFLHNLSLASLYSVLAITTVFFL